MDGCGEAAIRLSATSGDIRAGATLAALTGPVADLVTELEPRIGTVTA